MKNHENKYKILVLSDLKESAESTVKSAVTLAKMIDGEIDLFHVKKASEIVKAENPLSAIRTINDKQLKVINKIQKIIKPISEDYDFKIDYSFAFGNVKNEVHKYIKTHQPDIIVLGKRKSSTLSFLGDGITKFVVKKHDAVVMISDPTNTLEPNTHMSLGVLNGIDHAFNFEFADTLIANTQEPIKSFNSINNSEASMKKESIANKKTVEYVFEQGGNTIKNLSKYVSKNNINLLCVNRASLDATKSETLMESDFNEIMHNLNVSLLITGRENKQSTEAVYKKNETTI